MSIDRTLIEKWYQKYGPMVLRRCRQILGDEQQSYDAMQEVFIKVLQSQSKIQAKNPSSLLYRIATNHCINVIRHQSAHPATPMGNEILNLLSREEMEKSILSKNWLTSLFKKEAPSTVTMAVYHYLDGMTLEEVAREMKMSVSGVRKRLRTLKQNVGKRGEK